MCCSLVSFVYHDLWSVTPPSLSIQQWYPYMVFSFSDLLMAPAWFTWRQEKSLVRHSVHTNQGIYRTLTQRKGANFINFPIPHQLGTPVDGLQLLGQLPWALFRTHRSCCDCINWHPWQCTFPPRSYRGHSFYARNPLDVQKDQLLGFIPSLGHQLSDCQKVSLPYELERGKTLRTSSGSCRWTFSSHIS